jgi:hypothetical protein
MELIGLDALCKRMMKQICDSNYSNLYNRILRFIAIVYQPITLKELASLIKMLKDISDDLESLKKIVSLDISFLAIRGEPIYLVHQSTKDFLFIKTVDGIFPSRRKEAHHIIFSRSLHIMSRMLQRDIYSLRALRYPIEQVK